MVKIVTVQMLDNITLEACSLSALVLTSMATPVGMDNTTREATINKQVEILFRLIIVIFSGEVAFLRRTSLEILNSLKLRNTNGVNTVET